MQNWTNTAWVIVCHIIGDYVFQTTYIAEEKKKNAYIMFVHCIAYCIPFILRYNMTYKIVILFTTHIIIDTLKTHTKYINYWQDQVMHYIIAIVLFVIFEKY